MGFRAGQLVRILSNGVVGKIFLKLPSSTSELYLVQWPGFPVVEKVYYRSDLEAVEPMLRKSA